MAQPNAKSSLILQPFLFVKAAAWRNWEFIGITYVLAGAIYIVWTAFTENSLLIATAALIIVPLAWSVLRGVELYRRRIDR